MLSVVDRTGVVDAIRSLSEQAQALSSELSAARHAGGSAAARDRTGAVRVVVDGTGRATDIHIDHAWNRRLGSDEIGDAVLEAYRAAADTVLQRAAEAMEDTERGAGDRRELATDVPRYEPPSVEEMRARRIALEVEFVRLEELKTRAASARPDPEPRDFGSDVVRVSASRGQVLAVTVDERRATRISGAQLARAALAAFAAAQRTEAG
jgi:DNA-binding protein YbaB